MARPQTYNKDIHPAMVLDYLNNIAVDKYVNLGTKLQPRPKLVVNLPSIEGLAIHMDLHRDTIYDWASKFVEFSDTIEDLRQKQAERLINKFLSGDYQNTMAKILLSQHGYRERTEVENTNKNYVITEEVSNANSKDKSVESTS